MNVVAFLLQAFVTSRLVKYRGLRGVLLALPLIALGGYAIIAAGVGFSVVRWIKTAENATDYSIMNTARQLLWLPTTREEKYKAKQAIDTFFVRGGDVLSAGVVYVGPRVLHLTIEQFATVNIVLTVVWLGVALMILWPKQRGRVPAAAALGAGGSGAGRDARCSSPAMPRRRTRAKSSSPLSSAEKAADAASVRARSDWSASST